MSLGRSQATAECAARRGLVMGFAALAGLSCHASPAAPVYRLDGYWVADFLDGYSGGLLQFDLDSGPMVLYSRSMLWFGGGERSVLDTGGYSTNVRCLGHRLLSLNLRCRSGSEVPIAIGSRRMCGRPQSS